MVRTWQGMMTVFIMVVMAVGYVAEGSAWGESCAKHQAVLVEAPDLNVQAQQFAIPPSTQQRAQPKESYSIGWGEGVVGVFMVLSAIAFGIIVRLKHKRVEPAFLPQLALAYSNSEPVPVASVA
ncbi:MAG: hypothetical protein OEY86_20230 [Nitrospira sp.]|nr:hypothetical protein [Nitrospira sp.]